jgi:hypothetical protein
MSLPMAADCLRHFWLAVARPKLFQSVVFAGRAMVTLSRSEGIAVSSGVAGYRKRKSRQRGEARRLPW